MASLLKDGFRLIFFCFSIRPDVCSNILNMVGTYQGNMFIFIISEVFKIESCMRHRTVSESL
jgi:hypothetical protein